MCMYIRILWPFVHVCMYRCVDCISSKVLLRYAKWGNCLGHPVHVSELFVHFFLSSFPFSLRI